MSVSRCPLRSFVLGFLGHAPWCVLYSWIGCSIDSLRDLNSAGTSEADQSRAWGGLVALGFTAIVLTLTAHRALHSAVSQATAARDVGDGTAGRAGQLDPESHPALGPSDEATSSRATASSIELE